MRLINTETLELHEVYSIKTAAYAILSHRWDEGEVSFQDLRDGRGPGMKGWKKIRGCCAKAFKDGWDYVVSCFDIWRPLADLSIRWAHIGGT